MKARKLFALLLVVCMVVSLFPAVYAAEEAEVTFWDLKNTENVSTEELAITVYGEAVDVAVYNIGGNNYFKLRDLAAVIGFTVDYDAATRTIEIL